MGRKSDGPWRLDCLMKRGTFCRSCGATASLEVDHIWPKGQQGPSVVENGLVLCGSWGSCGAHERKTRSELLIERSWLDDDQIAWLDEVSWVRWDPETGDVSGNGWRHFAPIDPRTGRTRQRRDDETPLTAPAAAQPQEADMADEPTEPIPEDDEGYADPALAAVPDIDDDDGADEQTSDGTLPEDDLAAAADAALAAEGEPVQGQLDGTSYAKIKFVGMAYEQPQRPDLREEVEFRVKGRCVGHSEEVMADGDVRELAKIEVTSVELIEP